ncbi:MAG TPA: aminodeoxychorismate/anthranilate synthase component II [Actinomycetales bacterium]|nr:aminodeoxychorismate/anthranilate synthase component II [Actinomycetales bacterium]
MPEGPEAPSASAAPHVLVIDNFDSFVHTIASYLEELGADLTMLRNDAHAAIPPALESADAVLISPGPGNPKGAGASLEVIEACAASGTPMLGICLGHQALGEAFGGLVGNAPQAMHGKTSRIAHDSTGVFVGLPSPFTATRYHSLAIDPRTLPDELVANAWVEGEEDLIMGVRHRTLPLHAVQFHPESVLTEGGYRLLANWLAISGGDGAPSRAQHLTPHMG